MYDAVDRWSPSESEAIDENDPVFGEADYYLDQCAFAHLAALEDAIENEELRQQLQMQGTEERIPAVDADHIGKSTIMEATQVTSRNKNLARYIRKMRRESVVAARTAIKKAVDERTASAEDEFSRWAEEANEEPVKRSLESRNSDFVGYGYHAKVSSYAERCYEASPRAKAFRAASCNVAGAQKRVETSTRRETEMREGEEVFMAFAAFDGSQKSVDDRDKVSVVVDKEVYSIVDSGSTVNVQDLSDGTVVENFRSDDYATIMGYNGSTTKSKGSGTVVGFMTATTGARVPIKVQRMHDVRGAPNGLLSIRMMMKQGFEFHFTPQGSYIIAPDRKRVNLSEKEGLYWLRWTCALDAGEPTTEVMVRRRKPAQSSDEAEANTADQAVSDPHMFFGDGITCMMASEEQTFDGCSEKDCERCHLAARSRARAVPLSLMHRRLGHFNQETIKRMVKAKAINCELSDTKPCECEICKLAKAKRSHVPTERENERDEDLQPFARVWTDVKGKVKPKDHWGNQYIVTFTCEKTRWVYVDFARKKSDIKNAFKGFLDWLKPRGWKLKLLQSDNGGEYTSNGGRTSNEWGTVISDFEKISSAHGVVQNFTCANTPEQNGIAERLNRTLVELARSLLIEAGLSETFWSLAVKHVVYCRNRIWHKVHQVSANVGASAFQVLYGKPPNIEHLRVWGCDAYKLDTRQMESTFQRKSKKMIYVGTSSTRKGWVLFDPKTRKLTTTYHVSFNEDMSNRRCALRDFDLRSGNKAGSGASREEERDALLERGLYNEEAEVSFEDVASDEVTSSPVEAISDDHVEGGAEEAYEEGVTQKAADQHAKGPQEPRGLGAAEESDDIPEDVPRGSSRGVLSRTRDAATGGEDATESRNGGRQFSVPPRRAVVGAKQDLDEDDQAFLKTAMQYSLPCEMQQRNPKSGSSRARYEKYKHGKTLREIKRTGATWGDIVWDYSRGYIDFSPTAASNAAIAKMLERDQLTPIASSPGSYIDDEGHVVTNGQFCGGAFEESVQQDFAMAALDHIESMSHRAQELLKRALGQQTLTQFAHCCASRIVIPEPLSVTEAMASEHAAEWKQAMQEEIDTLTRFKCFKIVPKSEAVKHGRLVKSKWVYKLKREADGSIQRFKARLVAKGFTQVPGSDYYETYSPVFSYASFRMLLAMAVEKDLVLTSFDLKSSFIQQKLDVPHLYMECPEGYDKFLPDGRPAALHCLQSIYGLKQSSRLLHERMVKFLTAQGFKQLISDQCVFVRGKGAEQVIVATWVDDIILASSRSNAGARAAFDAAIRKEFEMSPWTDGEADWVLNMKIVRDWERGKLHLSQPAAIKKLAERFGQTGREGRAPTIPISPTVKFKKPAVEETIPASEFDYQSAVGGLLYLALTARPDIAYAVGMLSRFMSCPGKEHVEAAKQTIRYLYGTKEWGITYSRGVGGSPHLAHSANSKLNMYMHSRKSEIASDDTNSDSRIMRTYCDADLAGDEGTRKSTSGYGMVMNGGVVCWSSRLQSTVALSTAEAETNAGVEAVKQLMHLRLFLRELGQEQTDPSTVYEDNVAAMSLAHGKEQSKRAKHYQIKVHFMNEQFKRGTFEYRKVSTKEQLGDVWTKALPRDDFQRYREWMGVQPASAISS